MLAWEHGQAVASNRHQLLGRSGPYRLVAPGKALGYNGPVSTAALAKVQPHARTLAISAGLFLLFWLIYCLTGSFKPTPYNPHVHLAYSMLHGSFAMPEPTGPFEIFRVNGKPYVAYGVGPALLMLPFVAIWGLGFHQAMFCAALAAASVTLWWLITGRLGLDSEIRTWLTVIFGLGSLFWFYGGQSGSGAPIMHVAVVFGLMLAIWECLGKQRAWLVGLGFGIAVLSRQPALVALPFFVGMLWQGDRKVRQILWFGVGLGVLLAFNGYYNWARFGNLLDNGYARVNAEIFGAYATLGDLHWNYLKQNIHGYFLKLPERIGQFPWFDPTTHGFTIFLSLPALAFAFDADYRKRMNALALFAAVAIMSVYLFYFWSGWVQFGRRYSVDALPFMMLLIASGARNRRGPLLVGLALLGVVVEVWGIFWWHTKGL